MHISLLPECSLVKSVNLVAKSVTITEMMNFPKGLFLLVHPVDSSGPTESCVRWGLDSSFERGHRPT